MRVCKARLANLRDDYETAKSHVERAGLGLGNDATNGSSGGGEEVVEEEGGGRINVSYRIPTPSNPRATRSRTPVR